MMIGWALSACQPDNHNPVLNQTIKQPSGVTPTGRPETTPTPTPKPTVKPSPTPRLGCEASSGSIVNELVDEEGFAKPMEVNVYLPPCYSENHPGGYPTLYLIHGQSFTNDQWIRLGVPQTADALFIDGMLKPFMVVMPREEYYLEDWFQSKFGENLANGLVTRIDRQYNTCQTRDCRAIGGLSRGATWSVVIGLTYWQKFGTIGAHSLPESPFAEAITRDMFKAMAVEGYPRLYVDIGRDDGLRSGAQNFIAYLEKYDIPHEWHINQGGHNEEYWQAHVRDYLLWYGQAWK